MKLDQIFLLLDSDFILRLLAVETWRIGFRLFTFRFRLPTCRCCFLLVSWSEL